MNDETAWVFPSSARASSDPRVRAALGPLATVADDLSVTDVFVTCDGRVFADHGSGALQVAGLRLGGSESVELARRLIEEGGRHLDEASPVVDVRLTEGIRVHAALPPVAVGGAIVSICFSRQAMVGIDDLNLAWTRTDRDRILSAIDSRQTLLISGSTGSGKTTLLGALLSRASPHSAVE